MWRKTANRNERGQGLVLAVLAMAVLLGFVAMSVDIGLLYNHRRDLQNAADAAALAGAVELPDNPDLAVTKAQEWAAKNGIDPSEIESIEVQTTSYPNDTLHVEIGQTFDWVFARVLGKTQSDVGAEASAKIGSPVAMSGLKPWAVTDAVLQGLMSGDPVTLKYNAQDPTTGNFQPIRLDGSGASVYGDTIRYGSESTVCAAGYETPTCPSVITTETGNLVGPTRQAVNWLEANTPSSCDDFTDVFTPDLGNPGEYELAASCNPWSSEQPATMLAVIPVIDQLCNGSCDVTVLRFAMVLLEGINCTGAGGGQSCSVTATYVEAGVDVEGLIGAFDPDGSVYFVRLVE